MLFVLLFSYLIRSGKLKRAALFFKTVPRKIGLKFYRPETALIFGFIIAGA